MQTRTFLAIAAVLAACGSAVVGAKPAPRTETAVADPYALATDPVSGERLGADAVVREYEGREVRFASERSAAAFEEDVKKNLAALDKEMADDQRAFYPMDVCVVGRHAPQEGEAWAEAVYQNRLVRFCCYGCEFKMEQEPAKYLTELDGAAADKQREGYPLDVCVVGGGELGGMGEPHEVVIANRLVRLCCAMCEDGLREDAPKYIAELDAAWRKAKPEMFADAPAAE